MAHHLVLSASGGRTGPSVCPALVGLKLSLGDLWTGQRGGAAGRLCTIAHISEPGLPRLCPPRATMPMLLLPLLGLCWPHLTFFSLCAIQLPPASPLLPSTCPFRSLPRDVRCSEYVPHGPDRASVSSQHMSWVLQVLALCGPLTLGPPTLPLSGTPRPWTCSVPTQPSRAHLACSAPRHPPRTWVARCSALHSLSGLGSWECPCSPPRTLPSPISSPAIPRSLVGEHGVREATRRRPP